MCRGTAGFFYFCRMSGIGLIWHIMMYWLPVISTFTWAVLLLLAYRDSRTGVERRVRGSLLAYMSVNFFAWICLFCYSYFPAVFAALNAFAYWALLTGPVLFYCYIWALTSGTDEYLHFPRRHFVFPVAICGVMVVWSLFVPWEVQVELVTGRGAVVSGWEAYSRFFLSKPPVRLLYNSFYIMLSVARLYVYYHKRRRLRHAGWSPSGWIRWLMFFACTLMLASLALNIVPRSYLHQSVFFALVNLLFAGQHIIQGYNALSRNFLLHVPRRIASPANRETAPAGAKATSVEPPVNVPEVKGEATETDTSENSRTSRKVYTRYTDNVYVETKVPVAQPLTRKRFESWMRANKPWLDPHLKITDLLEPLEVNRTYLSGFINKTYNMNFNRYINHCRLRELERLAGLRWNKDKDRRELSAAAGFASVRNYQRALREENRENE